MAEKKILNANALTRELGTSGLSHWSGRIQDDWLREFSDERKWRTIREMRENDAVIGAVLFAIDMLIRQIEWRVEPASDSPDDVQAAEFVESNMEDMSHSWDSLISEILSMLPYGFSYFEIIYKKRLGQTKNPSTRSRFNDGLYGWRKIPIRAQSTLDHWLFDGDGGIQGFVQRDPMGGELFEIPIEKSLLFRTSHYKNNPEGRSVLRSSFRSYAFKKRIEEIEGIGIERDLAGLPVIYAPNKIMLSGANAKDSAALSALKDIVRNIRRDEQEGIVMPGDRDEKGNRLYELELLSTGGSRNFDTNSIITRYDQRIAMTLLADFILLGHEKAGSFALSDSKTDMFGVALKAWVDEISSIFNRHAIPRLFNLNGMKVKELPQLTTGDIEKPDLQKLGEYISKLSGAGADLFPDIDLENALRDAASLPQKQEDDSYDMPATPAKLDNPEE